MRNLIKDKKMKNNLLFFLLFTFLFCANVFSAAKMPSKLIDTPINSFYNPNEFSLDMMMYKDGGFVNWIEMGIKPGFNIGFSIDFFNMIGDGEMKTREPKISARLLVYRGNLYLPAFNVGYLGQGYGEYKDREYENAEKGFYVSAEKELFFLLFVWNFGLNMSDFKESELHGFVNARYFLADRLLVMIEYDNIRVAPQARLNLGFKYYITNNLSMGLGVRDLKRISKDEKDEKNVERIFMITYVGKFRLFDR